MKLSAVLQWLDAHWLAIGAVLGTIAAAWKAIPAAKREAFERSNPRLVGFVRAIVSIAPDLVGAYRTVRYQAVGGEPRASVMPPPAVPPRAIDPESGGSSLRGFAVVDAVVVAGCAFVIAASAALLAGCPLPPQDFCTPLTTRCSPEGVPQSCSPTQRWTSGALQRPCAQRAAGAVCCRARSPYERETHACVPAAACLPETSAPDAGAEGGAL